MTSARPPVIAVDGPAASGKGTVAGGVAKALGFHLLDSGSLYRLVALDALRKRVAVDDAQTLAELARQLDASFDGGRITLAGLDVTDALRGEDVGAAASRVAVHPAVREALLERLMDLPDEALLHELRALPAGRPLPEAIEARLTGLIVFG